MPSRLCDIGRVDLKTQKSPCVLEKRYRSSEKRTASAGRLYDGPRRDAPSDEHRTDFPGKFGRSLKVTILPNISLFASRHLQPTREMPSMAPA